jgi:hypothetical protein
MDENAAAKISDQEHQIVAAFAHMALGGRRVAGPIASGRVILESSAVELGDLGQVHHVQPGSAAGLPGSSPERPPRARLLRKRPAEAGPAGIT